MSKILLIPDIHGRDFWKKAKNFEGEIVFLGDYLDPYCFEFDKNGKYQEFYNGELVKFNIAPDRKESCIENLKEIISFAKSRNNVTLLLGNHDYHYLYMGFDASRKDTTRFPEIKKLFLKNSGIFKDYYIKDNLLCTHAGASIDWVSLYSHSGNFEDAISNAAPDQKFSVSSYRGGTDRCSGPLWLDVNEITTDKNKLYTDSKIKYQVFGHTILIEQGSICKRENGACIDSREIFEIDTKNPENTLKVWNP